MNSIICSCGQEMKLIPGGISKKTGKKYNAFYACETCKATANPANVNNPAAKIGASIKADDTEDKRTDAILTQVSLKCAVDLYKNENIKDIKKILGCAEIMDNWLKARIAGKKHEAEQDFLKSNIPF